MGNFEKFEEATGVKNDLRKMGYNDAFVVVFYNGHRITVNEAINILQKEGKEVIATNNTSAGIPNNANIAKNIAPAVPKNEFVVVTKELEKSNGLLFTVQIGVYSREITRSQLWKLDTRQVAERERALFYLEINRAVQEFRKRHALSPAELNAFLYDFAPSCVEEERDDELPAPQRAWFLMAGVGTEADFTLLDGATAQTVSLWRGHRDARKGDIAMVWCASPRAYLHSIWRIVEDGQDDPFSHWYSVIRIGHPQPVPHLKIKALKAHPVLATSPMVRAHFQGCAGKYFRPEDYTAVLEIFTYHGLRHQCIAEDSSRSTFDIDRGRSHPE